MANEAFLLSFHRDLLSDTDTQGRFRDAIRAAVHEGDRVLDLGAGTGVHAVFACRAGASRVYAIENDPIDGPRIRQIPAGGGEPTVLARDNDVTAYDILPSGLAAAGGFVYFMGDDGTEAFFRVKRR